MSGPIEHLAGILAKVTELHQPQPIYGECLHHPEYGCTPVEAPWVDACNQSIEGWYCPTCCTANDVYLQADCPHGWDHTRTSQSSACRTADILVAAARWFTE